ncbi:MAG: FAD:protein FMN transferase [Bacteroidetes bacterium]|nr:FAD:protein FMN transferase [Bacteroidota bacterium]MDA1119860.1 FAD:protein FMN transferase [Bacteroidota bacterium]
MIFHKPYLQLVLFFVTVHGIPAVAQELVRYTYEQPKMGTTFKIILYSEDSERAENASNEAFQRIDELNAIFSDYEEESEISQLSDLAGTGKKQRVSPDMWEILVLANEISKRSKGAFDITIGPLSKLWRRAIRQMEFPGMDKIEEARSKVNYRWLKLYKNTRAVLLKKEGMRLDAGGIAKGYAVDEAFKVLKSNGIDRALIDGGGDIYVGSPPPRRKGWNLAFLTQGSENIDQTVQLTNQAIASSGDTYQFIEWEEKRYSHIIDPLTGLGVTDQKVINIIAPSCTLADALASAVSVMTEERSKKLIKRYPDVELK